MNGMATLETTDPAAELADVVRGYWTIEVRLHRVRDVVYDEDRSQIRTANDHMCLRCS